MLQVIRVHFCFALLAVVFGGSTTADVGAGTGQSSLASGGFTGIQGGVFECCLN